MTHNDIFSFPQNNLPIVKGKLTFAVVGLQHSHIYGMTHSLINAGAELKWVFDDNPSLINPFLQMFPSAHVSKNLQEILADNQVQLVVSADIPSKRADLAVAVMNAGCNFFVDKAPALTLKECEDIRETQSKTGKKFFVYYSELIENDASIFAKNLINRGVIGKLCHVDIFAPHLLNAQLRPKWFWERKHNGGIITDIGSHQIEQFLEFSNCINAKITSARVKNYFHKDYPTFEDFGDITIESENGVTGYFRVDWLSPEGINTFGDLRTVLLGEKGFIELRKTLDIGTSKTTDNVIVALKNGVFKQSVTGKLAHPFFVRLINDCLTGSNTAMPLDLIFSTMELTVKAQMLALNAN